jgi:hypothetical protein
MMDKKEYKIPTKIRKIHNRRIACEKLAHMAVKIPVAGFYYSKKLMIEVEDLNMEFWAKCFNLYPELKENPCRYNSDIGVVTVNEEEKGK